MEEMPAESPGLELETMFEATPEQSLDMQLEMFMRQLSTSSEESAATLELMLRQAVPDHYED